MPVNVWLGIWALKSDGVLGGVLVGQDAHARGERRRAASAGQRK
jgi:hypothetical protein